MRVFVAGASGQLGQELLRTAPDGVRITAPTSTQLSIVDRGGVAKAIAAARPHLVVNLAAYTEVDEAESQRDEAFAINAGGAQVLAESTAKVDGRMIQISTDYVFDGEKARPYSPEDPPKPLGVYGASKVAGERAVLETLGDRGLVIRTSWLYSSHGRNFVSTIMRLLTEQPEVKVVTDQVGSPTWARNLASAVWTWATIEKASGVRHFCDAGVASWYDFAVAIQEIAAERSALASNGSRAAILPIRSCDHPTPAPRPASSILGCFESWRELGLRPSHWRVALSEMFSGIRGVQGAKTT